MQVKSIAECSCGAAVLLTCIKLTHGLKTFVLSIFKLPLKTGFNECSRHFQDKNSGRIMVKACLSFLLGTLCIIKYHFK